MTSILDAPLVSVIMPVYKQEQFIRRAIASLLNQVYSNWELIIINDGSPDATHEVVQEYMNDHRIQYHRNLVNTGLGASLNLGLDNAKGIYIAYLPADDVIYKDHLSSLLNTLFKHPEASLAYAFVKHHYNKIAEGYVNDEWLQLVQVMHRKTTARWMERNEIESDDLNKLFWNKLEGEKISSGQLTCEWVDHPFQRYKLLREPVGGINPFKLYYNIKQPLRYHTSVGNYIDEVNYFKRFRERPDTPASEDGLKIVLVGELAYNSERVLALEEQGHKLYGLWMKDPYWYNNIGPLPFGHVEDIPYENWQERLAEIQPDVIYALLNWQAVPFAHEILKGSQGIPFVWHFKEGPFICLEKGTWNELLELYTKSDGQIYTSPEMRDWFLQFIPGKEDETLVLDGDLPKKEWFTNDVSEKLSKKDGEIHTVVPGRPIGLHPHTVAELGEQKIHVHFYGDFTHGQWKEWIIKTQKIAPGYLHIHPNCTQESWVKEFSQYDAGWLHFFKSENNGELMRANWDDLNYPARMSTLAAAGLPMLQRDNTGHIVATQSIVQQYDIGVCFDTMENLGKILRDKNRMEQLQKNVWEKRMLFSMDYHVQTLINFFRKIIEKKRASLPLVKAIA